MTTPSRISGGTSSSLRASPSSDPGRTANQLAAKVTLTVDPDLIQVRSRLWVPWARIALKHEVMAEVARQESQRSKTVMLDRETDAGLVGICATAFALEALSRELIELRVIPPATLTAWANKPPPAGRYVLEVLKHAVDPKGLVATWKPELRWLFDVRRSSVHYQGAFEGWEPHPLGTEVAVTSATYLVEKTSRAVDLLVSILERCRDKPKPPAKQWSHDMHRILDELISRRRQAV